MLTESGGWRRHLERRVDKSPVRTEGGVDSNMTECLIRQKKKLVKKIQTAGDSGHSVINEVRVWFCKVSYPHHCKPSVKPSYTPMPSVNGGLGFISEYAWIREIRITPGAEIKMRSRAQKKYENR